MPKKRRKGSIGKSARTGASRPKGVNLGALRQAAAHAVLATLPRSQPQVVAHRALIAPRRIAPQPVLMAKPEQRNLGEPKRRVFSKPRNVIRAVTQQALGDTNKRHTRKPDRLTPGLREAICRDYKAQTKQRRATMFASGSAGKGRRNPGPKQRDWRAEVCK